MAETTLPQETTQTLEESLNKTDFGHWVFEHRKAFIGAILATFVLASGWLLYRQYAFKAARELSGVVHQFEQSALTELRSGKMTTADFMTKFNALDAATKGAPAMLPVALEAANLMNGKNEVAEAATLLEAVVTNLKTTSPLYVFVVPSYSAILEKNGKVVEAAKAWDDYIAGGHKVILPKAYLELGRLNLLQGQKDKAKTNFDYIVANYPNDELAKLARLYLQQLTTP